MSVKKINGYRIFLSEKLGKGSYGTVTKQLNSGLSGRKQWNQELMCSQNSRQIK